MVGIGIRDIYQSSGNVIAEFSVIADVVVLLIFFYNLIK